MSRYNSVLYNWTEVTNRLLHDKQLLAYFLRFSAGMYKQSFSDAALIFQQNPYATKVATLETWNRLGRMVNRGECSIAVFGEDSRCRHLFDITQTNGRRIPDADCINPDGTVSKIDMTRQEYELMTTHTYAPENRQALAMAKAKLAEREENAGIQPKPTEQYAVRQSADHRYSVVTISADGLVTPVIPHLKSVPEAKKAMLELYEQRSKTARFELVHPQVLDEKSAALYSAQEELPQTVYRIQLSRQKDAADTHYVQQYVKCSDDGYKVGKVMARGDYFACNIALGKQIAQEPEKKKERITEAVMTAVAAVPPTPPVPEAQAEREAAPTPPVPAADYAIYQLKGGDETRDLRFEPYNRLTQQGQKPDMANYDLVYEGSMADVTDNPDLRIQLEAIYRKFNLEHPDDFTGHSLSVSDVVVVRDQAFYVDSFGFKPLPDFLAPAITTPEQQQKPKQNKPKL